MGKWFPRSSKGRTGRVDRVDTPADVFEQPERGLIVEAITKPVGLFAALLLISAAGVFAANHFMFHQERVDDFALLGFFVGGGIFLSTLLRTGDPDAASQKPVTSARVQDPALGAEAALAGDVENEMLLEATFEEPASAASRAAAAKAASTAPTRQATARQAPGRQAPGRQTVAKQAKVAKKAKAAKAGARVAKPAMAPTLAPGLAEAPAPSPTLAISTPVPTPASAQIASINRAGNGTSEAGDDEVGTFEQALVHYANAGDLHGQGEVLRRLGHLAKGRGHLKESREFYMNSRNCFRKIEDHYAEAAVLLDLGQVLESLDEHDAASAAYRDANRALLDVAMNSGDRYNAIQAHAAD